jgi:phosphoribosylanthranilate isomerase
MKRFRIKVCGITREKDAQLAVKLGADVIGMIFSRVSPRYMSVPRALQVAAALPPTTALVGVFVDEPVDRIVSIGRRCRLGFVQLHGSETNRHVQQLKRAGFRVIKAFNVTRREDYNEVLRTKADLVLLDNTRGEQRGGTGKAFDWSVRPRRRIANLVLAGGINSDNVAEGVRIFDPLVVDVNSGVEIGPGIKSPTRMRTLFEICNRLRYGSSH